MLVYSLTCPVLQKFIACFILISAATNYKLLSERSKLSSSVYWPRLSNPTLRILVTLLSLNLQIEKFPILKYGLMLTNPIITKIQKFFRFRKPNIANYSNLHTGLMLTNPNIAKKAKCPSSSENTTLLI